MLSCCPIERSYCFGTEWIVHLIVQLIFNHDFKWSFVQCGFLWTCSHGLSHQFIYFFPERNVSLYSCLWAPLPVSCCVVLGGFQEMFQINAAVMGFSRSSSTWMPVPGANKGWKVKVMACLWLGSTTGLPLTRPYLRPLFLGGRYVGGGGVGWLAINSELVGMGAIENTSKSWFATDTLN